MNTIKLGYNDVVNPNACSNDVFARLQLTT